MTYEELIDIAEEAIRDVHDMDVTLRDYAIAAVAAIAKHAAIMPREATEEMLDVMHDSVRILVVPSERRADIQNDVEVYAAMLKAGEIKPVKED